ncbi:OLC1v1029906C1 [Oldenlandia corymbosa var. corymbosa]|uniref:OLC1v1029906C1 n=1 Tax=Oldenlandia corymbosa var. corymbosa TaxID=529605 RepID=A0AAV1CI49_OLDCO|nr:OLC1v1029906C1 [Oldenlandia corymbosa var. corymbosa]
MDEIVHPVPEQPISIQRDINQLDESIREQEQRIRKLETKAAQNVNLYFIFQAVILTSTATATSLTCHHWWIPFILSLLAAVQNFFAFGRTMIRVLKLREKLEQDSLDLSFMKLHRIRKDQVNQVLPGANFDQFQDVSSAKRGNEIRRPKAGSFQKWRGHLLTYCPLVLLVLFSGLVMYGCHILLCHNNGGKCVKLC